MTIKYIALHPRQLTELCEGMEKLKLKISKAQQDVLIGYIGLLMKWNTAFNLVSKQDMANLISRHILDCLAIQRYLQGSHFLDVGTGAGLPGLLLAIVNPDKQFTLLDSNQKKTRFLVQAIYDLKLTNVKITEDRIEKHRPEFCYDGITSRAFAGLQDFVLLTHRLLCPTGKLYAMKGEIPTAEIEQLSSHYDCEILPLFVPGLDAQRHLIVIYCKT